MRSTFLKASTLVAVALFAVSSCVASTIPVSPWPGKTNGSKLASIPVSPWPGKTNGSKLASIPLSPWPGKTNGSKLV